MDFTTFKDAMAEHFKALEDKPLFRTAAPKDGLWETYLGSFPEGANPMFRERTEHDCNCCKQFIRAIGNAVTISGGELISIWDCDVKDPRYAVVAKAMSDYVKSFPIENIFLHTERVAGTDFSHEAPKVPGGNTIRWPHFFAKIPACYVVKGEHMGTLLSHTKADHDVLLRSLKEFDLDIVDTVLDLIAQNSLYRGEEHKKLLSSFKNTKKLFDKVPEAQQDLFVWSMVKTAKNPAVMRIRNTVIGTLLADLAEGKPLEDAVGAYEAKVAPVNYKRPTALVTKKMVDQAKKAIEELGYMEALNRRYAVVEDLTINNVLFADRTAKKQMDVFDELAAETVAKKPKNLDKVETVTMDTFVKDILPKVDSIELLFEHKHASNLVSLIAPEDTQAKGMFKWPNNFSWSYTGDLTDSIKERVKRAGGNVSGDVRCSLSWYNRDDLDLHMVEPNGFEIYFGRLRSSTGGHLDVDMNAHYIVNDPVENICYPDRKRMPTGKYVLKVNNYNQRESKDVGFEVEIEVDGVTHTFSHSKALTGNKTVVVAEIHKGADGSLKVIPVMDSQVASKEIWGIKTQTFHKVSLVLNSPNHWDEHQVGNKHYLFMLEGCKNDEPTRGFYNEFLSEELNKHRKVFEVLGSKMKVAPAERQLSGLGFSSTKRTDILCKVTGSFSRMLKITV